MKAALIRSYGEPDVITIEDLPVPTISDDEVLIKVAGSSFNPADAAIRSGALKEMIPISFPHVLGADAAGIVAEKGAKVSGLEIGDRVYTYVDFTRHGGLAEFVAAKADDVALAPRTLPLGDAAVLPAVGSTAWQALFDHGAFESGQRVLIVGASGGVGTLAVQLAKWKAAEVIAVASERNRALLEDLGADTFIDHGKDDVVAAVGDPVDVVVNLSPISPDAVTRLLSVLRPGGVLVSALFPADEQAAERKGVRAVRMASYRSGAQLREIARLVDEDVLKPAISARRRLEDVIDVHRQQRSTYGKIALTVDPSIAG